MSKNVIHRSNLFLYKCIMANTSAVWQQASNAAYQLSSPSCSTGSISKSLTLKKKKKKKKERIFWGKTSGEGRQAKGRQKRKKVRSTVSGKTRLTWQQPRKDASPYLVERIVDDTAIGLTFSTTLAWHLQPSLSLGTSKHLNQSTLFLHEQTKSSS